MKITAVTSYPVKVGFRNQFVVKIDTDDGISGVGEGGMSGREKAWPVWWSTFPAG
ncbi:MAG: hypothetical protein R2848_04815 [Thermomicrobiales bacterium]